VNTFLGQLPALAGVILGIAGTILATFVADRERWKRNQASRWDEKRLNAYTEYAKALKDVHKLAFRLTASRISVNGSTPTERGIGLELLEQAESAQTIAWEAVLLPGDEPTVTAARQWRNAVGRLGDFARDSTDKDESAEWMTAVRAADELRDGFYSAARRSLNMGGGSVAQAPWLLSALYGQPESATGGTTSG
jgi:hypothetical protein